MSSQTWYLEFTDNGDIKRVGCMFCNATIAIREEHPVTKEFRLKHMSHMRTKLLPLKDGSKVELLFCPDCEKLDHDFPEAIAHLERTVRWGFMQEVLAGIGNHPSLKEHVKRAADIGRRLQIKRGKE